MKAFEIRAMNFMFSKFVSELLGVRRFKTVNGYLILLFRELTRKKDYLPRSNTYTIHLGISRKI